MEIFGYIAAFFIGVSLGLIGGGGSILAVPVFVYLFGLSPLLAISYSLFIVGITSLAGALNNFRKGYVHVKTALLFGLSSIATVFVTRKFIIPAIPEFIDIGAFSLSFALLTMVMFAILMILASLAMLRGRKESVHTLIRHHNYLQLTLYGIGIGLVTGFLGAGGGFILIPALVLLLRLPMKTAVGTSLLIIAMNSLSGFIADAGQYEVRWPLLLTISAIAIAGVITGGLLSTKIEGNKLKKGFAWFILLVAIYILARELFLK
ncbi:MAG: sulfite exporter TauE/SafE family protein [Chitinophagaceae bacterium]|nr:MAG: sulfite exporter TauE/SafE family protein [Chitinophagaceae bacterium]